MNNESSLNVTEQPSKEKRAYVVTGGLGKLEEYEEERLPSKSPEYIVETLALGLRGAFDRYQNHDQAEAISLAEFTQTFNTQLAALMSGFPTYESLYLTKANRPKLKLIQLVLRPVLKQAILLMDPRKPGKDGAFFDRRLKLKPIEYFTFPATEIDSRSGISDRFKNFNDRKTEITKSLLALSSQ